MERAWLSWRGTVLGALLTAHVWGALLTAHVWSALLTAHAAVHLHHMQPSSQGMRQGVHSVTVLHAAILGLALSLIVLPWLCSAYAKVHQGLQR